ncbi:MAG: beta-ketoacyl synthase chain length factor [Spongiibacteraceae bacterium]|nr:beta-ketoacyl synthase chain length factor [Spongiibacteraceae bacterium]
MIQFDIEDWRVWPSPPAAPSAQAASDEPPDVSFLPPMQRRRLSRFARIALGTAWPLAITDMPLVFASRHGETSRAQALLSDIARGEPVSPAQFSLSVHNALIGLWSILRRDRSEMTALAAEADGLEHAVLEAVTLLQAGAPAVLIVVAEDQPAELFARWMDDVPHPYALALRVVPGDRWTLTLKPGAGPTAQPARPHALSLAQALTTDAVELEHPGQLRGWLWRRLA